MGFDVKSFAMGKATGGSGALYLHDFALKLKNKESTSGTLYFRFCCDRKDAFDMDSFFKFYDTLYGDSILPSGLSICMSNSVKVNGNAISINYIEVPSVKDGDNFKLTIHYNSNRTIAMKCTEITSATSTRIK